MTLHGANRFVAELAEAAESRGYQLMALDLSGRHPMVRVQTPSGASTIEVRTEYGLGLDDLLSALPRPTEGAAT